MLFCVTTALSVVVWCVGLSASSTPSLPACLPAVLPLRLFTLGRPAFQGSRKTFNFLGFANFSPTLHWDDDGEASLYNSTILV